jgi:multiple sugar transport system permease protein
MTLSKKRALTAYGFLALPLLYFVAVRFAPMLYLTVMSATNWGLFNKKIKFVGIDNFAKIFADPVFLKSFGNTAIYTLVGTPAVIVLGLVFALELDKIRKYQAGFRLIYALPYITPVVAVSWVWRWMFQQPPFGVIDALLVSLGIPAQGFLNDPREALFCVVAVNVWVELGYCVIIFLAGIQTVPPQLVEAARIDGASERKITRRIILPLLRPITLFLVVMEAIQFLRIFTQVYNMSYQAQGGPLDSTKSAALFIYEKAFTNFDMGTAAAASLVLFAVIMVVTLLQLKFFDKKMDY